MDFNKPWVKYTLIALGIIIVLEICLSENNNSYNSTTEQTSQTQSTDVAQTTKQRTKAEESRYNDMSPADYHDQMKSDNLEYADIAWHAKNTYGWNCDEVTSLGDKINTSGNEIGDSYLESQLVGYYQVATCSSGTKLRVYPRKDTYPIITNINGGMD